MSKAILYMSMSLDGYIAGPDDAPDNGLGTGGPSRMAGRARLRLSPLRPAGGQRAGPRRVNGDRRGPPVGGSVGRRRKRRGSQIYLIAIFDISIL